MSETNLSDPSLVSLAEEYLRRRRINGTYSLESFANEFPHLRDAILDQFPVIVLAESWKEGHREASVAIPANLGRYEVGNEIGRGAMGIVVSASNPDLESEVAIKLLPFKRIRSVEILQRFHAEAKICAAMDHPNIVPVFDYGTDDNFAYLVMRKVDGMSLDGIIAELSNHAESTGSDNFQMDWEFITSIGIQAADALHYAHEQGVIHRDIKPANLILENERLWVSDFGLSKVLSSDVQLSMTGDVIGTPRYMAPEQLRGVCDARTDVYSLGVTLYELVALKPVGDPSLSTTQLLAQKQTLELPDLKTINSAAPAALCEIIMQAVELRPEDRFATAKEFSAALMQSTSGTFIGDRRRKDRQAKRRNRARTAVVAACVAVIASLGVYALGPTKDEVFADVLKEPDQILEILQQKESRDAIVDQLPQLVETFLDKDTEVFRTLMSEVATTSLEAKMDKAYLSEQEKVRLRKQMQQIKEVLIKYGYDSPQYAAVSQSNEQTLEKTFQGQCERLRRNVRKTDLPEEWKAHAFLQISRYQFAVENSKLSAQQESKIGKILDLLPSVKTESGDEPQLNAKNLQFFISHIKSEMDTSGVPAATTDKAGLTKVESRSAVRRPIQRDVGPVRIVEVRPSAAPTKKPRKVTDAEVGAMIDEFAKDPRTSKLIDKAKKDPRFSDLLRKIKGAQN